MSHPSGMDQDQERTVYVPNHAREQLNRGIESARNLTQGTFDEIKNLDLEWNSYSGNLQEYKRMLDPTSKYRTQNYIDEQYRRNLETAIVQNQFNFQKYQSSIIDRLKNTYQQVYHLINCVLLMELPAWKRTQQLREIGYNFNPGYLNIIQFWFVSLAKISLDNQNCCKNMKILADSIAHCTDEMTITTHLAELYGKFDQLLNSLVTNAFVIEEQPPLVMKKGNKFSVKFRSLLAGNLNLIMNFPEVTIHIISERQAKILFNEKKLNRIIRGQNANHEVCFSGEILNNSGTMEYDQTTGQLSITLESMHLEKINRSDKRGVADEKFSLLFVSKFTLRDETDAQVYTLSSPISVTVHGNQDPDASATIFWDSAFAEPDRVPFVVRDKVSWSKIATALSVKFASMTGKPLSADHLSYIAEKLFGVQSDYDSMTLSRSQFCKEGQKVKFWQWFFAIMKLIDKHLESLWKEENIRIHGFLKRSKAEEMLWGSPNGTFLLRFSDSELGGISIAWVGIVKGQRQVTMLQPLTCKDLSIRSLPNRLGDLTNLLYLYPQVPKDEAFGKYYAPIVPPSAPWNGYVGSILIASVPVLDGYSSNIESPSTQSAPQTPMPMVNDQNSFGDTASSPNYAYDVADPQPSDGNTNTSDFPFTEELLDLLNFPYPHISYYSEVSGLQQVNNEIELEDDTEMQSPANNWMPSLPTFGEHHF